MNQEELTNITNSITEKVGEDVAATIADDFGILITKNQEILNSIAEKDKMISDLQDRNSKLVASNGALLQQIPKAPIEPEKSSINDDNSDDEYFDYHSMFDENGNIKQK